MDRDSLGNSPPHVLLVHGMGRSPLAMVPLAWSLRRAGAVPHLFGYLAATESVDAIVARLTTRLIEIAGRGRYLVIGHSLGGLLLRAALARLPADVSMPSRLIMLGTPNHSPRLARRFQDLNLYKLWAGESGQLLADIGRMERIPRPGVPTTIVAGTNARFSNDRFAGEANDGIVALSEAELEGAELVTLPVWHTFMMNTKEVRELVVAKLGGSG